ncbi:hypothetical protein C5L31_000060 [Secundilactobacillus malefermentans]|uniref:Lipopolysaccharide biosynthesis glycosyltransferase n=1 Tax=Secundilactobacillus malefermentans TaxID=176292 RepID=A0A4R5NIJ8_9LACO|nr:glycosyltransferase [Secundilactobacillus malefermentans]KRM59932.1 lipopolysaccharide biosynthesis glycosyltransferase [Secundilactobacillus malefermentans DSM 5705 = KCTC 3548]TDG74413.1 hypothetical protein C5L31_000060 [Secundilactobacillus malefermentans]
MNILYCGNDKMADGLLISIISLLKHTKEPLHIFVLTAAIKTTQLTYHAIDDATIQFLNERVQLERPDSTVTKVDVTKEFMDNPPTANMNTMFTPYCMIRLYADLIPSLPDKLLYLDTDIICHQDFHSFYYQEMGQTEVMGVLDRYGKWLFHRRADSLDYMNSGVLLLNLAQIRQTRLFEKCRQMCATKWLFMPDQSALNKLAKSKKIVSKRFNEQKRLRKNTVFQHFTTSFRFWPWIHTQKVKPWQVDQMHEVLNLHAYDDILAEYQELQPKLRRL